MKPEELLKEYDNFNAFGIWIVGHKKYRAEILKRLKRLEILEKKVKKEARHETP